MFQFYLAPAEEAVIGAESSNVLTRFTLRYATEDAEGRGWSEYENDDWVFPIEDVGVFKIMDSNDVPRFIVIDRFDELVWEHATFSRVNNTVPPPLDKDLSEIGWQKWQREEVVSPEDEHKKIEHDETYIYTRPSEPVNRGLDGYTETGLRDAQEISLEAYTDGEKLTPRGRTEDIVENADIVFSGNKIEARRIQMVTIGTAAEIIITGLVHKFIGKLKAAGPDERLMREDTSESSFSSNLSVWVSRNENPLLELVSKATLSGGGMAIEGPDSRSDSGFMVSSNVDLGNSAITNDFIFSLWSNLLEPIAGLSWIQFGATVGNWRLVYTTGNSLAANQTLVVGVKFCDVRIRVSTGLSFSDDNFRDYYDDVIRNEGDGFLPLF